MTALPAPDVDYKKEIRFAVVMYGGVSLAIYINGIAQEFLRLVRSTAEAYESDGKRQALSAIPHQAGDDEDTKAQKLIGTERVYRKLSYLLSNRNLLDQYATSLRVTHRRTGDGQKDLLEDYLVNGVGGEPAPITTGFIVDILSGTSAGGINAIFLAKALANDQSIEKLKQLWVEQGDIDVLINDKKSLVGHNLDNQEPPKSLLNSRRMYLELLKAFDGMDRARPSRPSPYVNELDLYVTTTDIKGAVLPLQLSDKIVYEKRHRNVFHFKYGTQREFGQDRNHFLRSYNPFLAFAARCTSSFPFAFEPMRLGELDDLLKAFGSKDYDYAETSGAKSALWKPFFKENVDVAVDPNADFLTEVGKRSYGDGGYLDNKPFTYATETLARRQSTVPIERKLVYIEPSPEHPEDERQSDTPPNVLANAKAALLDLPAYETIREDLQRVLQRNRTFQRINRIVEATNEDLLKNRENKHDQDRYALNAHDWRLMDMSMMIEYCGIYFLPYRRLRVASVTDDLASLVARIKNIDDRSDSFVAIRGLVRAWRLKHYVENYSKKDAALVRHRLERHSRAKDKTPTQKTALTQEIEPTQETENAFLDDFDFAYRFRRLNFLLGKVDELLAFASKVASASADEAANLLTEQAPDPLKEAEDPLKTIKKVIRDVEAQNAVAFLTYLKCELLEVHTALRTMARKVRAAAGAAKRVRDAEAKKLAKEAEAKKLAKDSETGGAAAQAGKAAAHASVATVEEEIQETNRLISPNLDIDIAEMYEGFGELKLDQTQLKFILGIPGDVSGTGDIKLTANHGEEFARLDDRVCEERAQKLYENDATLNGLLNNIGTKLEKILGAEILLPTSNYCRHLLKTKKADDNKSIVRNELPPPVSKACAQIDIAKIPHEKIDIVRDYLNEFYIHFDDYDQVQFPILYQTDFGESAEVDIFRISPEDAPSLINERGAGADGRQKLAGNALFHFGAFLDRVWRENDIMWGRLDGAERLITSLLPDPDFQLVREKLISEAHLAILTEEMPPATRVVLSGLLSDALIRASSGEPFEEVLAKVTGPLKSPKVKQRLETAMQACIEDEKLLNYVKEHYEVNRQLEPKPLLSSVARATQVTGKIFDDIAQANNVESRSIKWIARAGQLFWGLVEVAVPGSIASLLFHHALKLLYMFEFLLLLFGTVFSNAEVQKVGWLSLGITVAVHTVQLVLGDALQGKGLWRYLILGPAGFFVFLIVVLGLVSFIGLLFIPSWVMFLGSVSTWIVKLDPPGQKLLQFVLLIFAGLFVLSAFFRKLSHRTRLLGVLPLLLGLAIVAGTILAFVHTARCHQVFPGGLHVPGLAIEMAKKADDIPTIKKLASASCTDELAGAAKLRKEVTIDFGFIGLYTLMFLVFSWWLSQRRFAEAKGIAIVAAILAIATAGFDVLENFRLYTVLDAVTPNSSMLHNLRVATFLKWISCFLTTGVLSVLFLARKDYGYALGLVLLIVSMLGILGLFYNPLLEFAFLGLGTVVFLIGLFIVIAPIRFRSEPAPPLP